jgi:hypothetical protein
LGQAELPANSAGRHTGLERGSNRIPLALGQCLRLTDLLLTCAAAEDSYRYALAAARRQSAKFWELRAVLGLWRH